MSVGLQVNQTMNPAVLQIFFGRFLEQLILNKMQRVADLFTFLIAACSGVEHIPVMGTLSMCSLRKK